jgi:hypothetical protein
MKRTTRWSPDTCECELEYEWDDAQAEAVREHSPARIIKACPAHAGDQGGLTPHFNKVLGENRHKNIVLRELLAAAPTALTETIDGAKRFLTGREPAWKFNALRELEIDFPGASDAQVAQLRTQLAARVTDGRKVTLKKV